MISRVHHIASLVAAASGAFLAGRDRSPSTALLGGVFLGAGLGIGFIHRREARR